MNVYPQAVRLLILFTRKKITTIHRLRMKNRKYTYAISRVREHELNVLQMILAAMPA